MPFIQLLLFNDFFPVHQFSKKTHVTSKSSLNLSKWLAKRINHQPHLKKFIIRTEEKLNFATWRHKKSYLDLQTADFSGEAPVSFSFTVGTSHHNTQAQHL